MAEKKPNAALRSIQGVPRSTTPSGVIHVRTYQSGQYVVVGNHLAQHRELSLTAIGLATHILSVPEGTPVDIRSLAERFPEGRERIASALRELEAHGYLRRVREHTDSGRLVTRTYAHHAPDAAAPAVAPLRVAGRPAAGRRTVERQPAVRADVPAAPEEDDQAPPRQAPEPEPSAPAVSGAPDPRQALAPEPAVPEVRATPHPRHDRAAALLAGLRRTDDRLILSRRDVDRLAPAVTAWLDIGVSAAVVHHALTDGLPADLRNPAKLIAYRLDALLPVPLPARAAPAPMTTGGPRAVRRPDPFQTCDGCERAFRAPQPGRCRECRGNRAVPGGSVCAA
ncbi:helix-turn-helix domain-containing protein [Streptomyces mexicanus]|uniref:Helix-turn-helix domain-containing protein n=1 Tax=Streptomyces mexicanus TaxID=178566 RepID=A0A7X1HVK2_9ACTN|nr:helix-turn-helix domain-containing protein [Streptomyces mexicanus]MBC2863909.1 helix-turn-helix domain-containing protein [Streptomyces mexicanus]